MTGQVSVTGGHCCICSPCTHAPIAGMWTCARHAMPMPTPTDHSTCSNAYKPVTCDRCGREYTCTPADDFYCTPAGDHCCEACLIGGLPLHLVEVDAETYNALRTRPDCAETCQQPPGRTFTCTLRAGHTEMHRDPLGAQWWPNRAGSLDHYIPAAPTAPGARDPGSAGRRTWEVRRPASTPNHPPTTGEATARLDQAASGMSAAPVQADAPARADAGGPPAGPAHPADPQAGGAGDHSPIPTEQQP